MGTVNPAGGWGALGTLAYGGDVLLLPGHVAVPDSLRPHFSFVNRARCSWLKPRMGPRPKQRCSEKFVGPPEPRGEGSFPCLVHLRHRQHFTAPVTGRLPLCLAPSGILPGAHGDFPQSSHHGTWTASPSHILSLASTQRFVLGLRIYVRSHWLGEGSLPFPCVGSPSGFLP